MNYIYLPEPVQRSYPGHPLDPNAPYEDDMEEVVIELMAEGAEYEPYSRANLCEALGELPDEQLISLGHALRDASADQALDILRTHVEAYWQHLARMRAEKLTRDNANCRVCHGAGCVCCDGGFGDE